MLKTQEQDRANVLADQLDKCKIKNTAIQKSLVRIFGKFEQLMHLENRVNTSEVARRDMLINA